LVFFLEIKKICWWWVWWFF